MLQSNEQEQTITTQNIKLNAKSQSYVTKIHKQAKIIYGIGSQNMLEEGVMFPFMI